MTAVYRLAPGLCLRRLDDEVAVYLANAFETHLLDDAGGQVVEALQQLQQASAAALLAHLTDQPAGSADALALAPDTHAEAALLAVLSALAGIGVLTSHPC